MQHYESVLICSSSLDLFDQKYRKSLILFSILIYICTILIKYHLFLLFNAEFSASLLHSSMHGPSDIILICWFIINVGNSCAAYFLLDTFLGVRW